MDLETLFLKPATLEPFVVTLSRRLAAHDIAIVCGPLTGGAFLAQRVASRLRVDFCYAERDASGAGSGGLYGVRYRIPAGLREAVTEKRVAVVDDVISAGSAIGGTLIDLRAAGGMPVVIGALLVLGDMAAALAERDHLGLERLAALPGRIWQPAECPLCAAGALLEVPARG